MNKIKYELTEKAENYLANEKGKRDKVIKEFEDVINSNFLENESNTPDFILAEYLMDCLDNYKKIHDANEKWYGKKLEIISD